MLECRTGTCAKGSASARRLGCERPAARCQPGEEAPREPTRLVPHRSPGGQTPPGRVTALDLRSSRPRRGWRPTSASVRASTPVRASMRASALACLCSCPLRMHGPARVCACSCASLRVRAPARAPVPFPLHPGWCLPPGDPVRSRPGPPPAAARSRTGRGSAARSDAETVERHAGAHAASQTQTPTRTQMQEHMGKINSDRGVKGVCVNLLDVAKTAYDLEPQVI